MNTEIDTTNIDIEIKPEIKTPIKPVELKFSKTSIPPTPTIVPPKPSTIIELLFNSELIEIVDLSSGMPNSIFPKIMGKIRLNNNNLYRISITNKTLNIDNYFAIRRTAKFAEYFHILSVSNGKVSILPIINGVELKSGDIIGELV